MKVSTSKSRHLFSNHDMEPTCDPFGCKLAASTIFDDTVLHADESNGLCMVNEIVVDKHSYTFMGASNRFHVSVQKSIHSDLEQIVSTRAETMKDKNDV